MMIMASFFGKKLGRAEDQPAGQTAPGVRMLKEVWNIRPGKPVEVTSMSVSSDIYSMNPKTAGVPPRHRGRRKD